MHRDGTVRDVPGGIDAWIARHLEPVAEAPSAIPRGRALRDAEKDMTRLERRKQRLSADLSEVTEPAEQARLGRELASVLDDLARAEAAWLAFFE